MPQVRMLGIEERIVAAAADAVVTDIAVITGCPAGDVVVSWLPEKTFQAGLCVPHPPIVEVWWFDRGQEQQDAVARAVTRRLVEQGITTVDVVFNLYERSRYYENGEHF